MTHLQHLHALEILDSRGNPTLEVIAITDTGALGKAAVPSGASTGQHEAVELRDGDHKRYGGKGVLKAVHNVNGPLLTLLKGQKIDQQEKIDQMMIEADGTPNKSNLGANAILGASLAIAKAAAVDQKIPLFRYLAHGNEPLLPCPMMNILNGGVHADNGLDIQEFMIRPIGAPSIEEAIRWGAEVFHALKGLLKKKGHVTSVGDEGGFAPRLTSNEEALDFILEAIVKAGYDCQTHFSLALDCAASEFYDSHTHLYAKTRTSEQQVDYLARLCTLYPIDSIEDGLDQNDWAGWKNLTERVGKKVQIVGDDLFVTNTQFLKKGIAQHAANAILIKVNQIGTLTETLQAIHLAQAHSFGTILSHRSGETEDTTIADIAVATRAGQIKTGSLSRSDRIAKYNRLLEISDSLKNK